MRRRFGLAEDDLNAFAAGCGAGIRWGIDAGIKSTQSCPPPPSTPGGPGWTGLLLGYALRGTAASCTTAFCPTTKWKAARRGVGMLQESFTEALFGLDARLRERRSLAAGWRCGTACWSNFSSPRPRGKRTATDSGRVETLRGNAELAEFDEPVLLSVVKPSAARAVEHGRERRGTVSGRRVTCCAMVPMRSIPFPVVCLLGMNDDAYPRPHRPVGFDLMATRFRRGDRSRRQDDRYLFWRPCCRPECVLPQLRRPEHPR